MSKPTAKAAFTGIVIIASGLLLASLTLPLWSMRMEAPQYRDEEALRVTVFPGGMRGDLQEIVVLNQYIGVHVPETLPQTRWLPFAIGGAAAIALGAAFLSGRLRRAILLTASVGLSAALLVAVLQARQQMHDIGHKRDAHTKLAGVRDFDPPFLGTARIAQFTVQSSLGAGAVLIGLALALQTGVVIWSARAQRIAGLPTGSSPVLPDARGGEVPA